MAEPPPPFKRVPAKKKTPSVGFFGQEDSFEGDMRVAKRGLTCSIFLLVILMLSVAYCGTRGESSAAPIDVVDAGILDAEPSDAGDAGLIDEESGSESREDG